MIKYLLLACVLILTNNCKSQQKKNVYQTIINTFIENRNLEGNINPKENVLIVGANTNEKDSYNIVMSFVNPKLLNGFKYNKVYTIDGYKLIIDESTELTNKPDILKKSFKEAKFEDFNLAKAPIDYNPKYWLITFNSKNEIIHISPYQKSKEIKELLLKKGVKFSKDFED